MTGNILMCTANRTHIAIINFLLNSITQVIKLPSSDRCCESRSLMSINALCCCSENISLKQMAIKNNQCPQLEISSIQRLFSKSFQSEHLSSDRGYSQNLLKSFLGHTPREPAISPFKPINRLLKTDRYNGTIYNRPLVLIL